RTARLVAEREGGDLQLVAVIQFDFTNLLAVDDCPGLGVQVADEVAVAAAENDCVNPRDGLERQPQVALGPPADQQRERLDRLDSPRAREDHPPLNRRLVLVPLRSPGEPRPATDTVPLHPRPARPPVTG